MTASTNKPVEGWSNTFAPKSENVKLTAWLLENGLPEDAENVEEWTTFADIRKYIVGKNEWGMDIVDCKKMADDITKNGYIDSLLRDILFDALFTISK